jgi:hypothetical protein
MQKSYRTRSLERQSYPVNVRYILSLTVDLVSDRLLSCDILEKDGITGQKCFRLLCQLVGTDAIKEFPVVTARRAVRGDKASRFERFNDLTYMVNSRRRCHYECIYQFL